MADPRIQKLTPLVRVQRTSVTKAPEAAPRSLRNQKELPPGILITGGKKLRQEGFTGRGVKVAVLDSGIDEKHKGFDGKVTDQFWFRYGTPLEDDDHGTHVAGTIHMMAPDAEIVDYRVFGKSGNFDVDVAVSTAIYEACFEGCDVINLSLGGRWPMSGVRGAIEFAHSQGVILVCAAGNEGDGDPMTNERSYPAMWPETISVAAVSKKKDLPVVDFSNSAPSVTYAGIGSNVVSFKPGGGFSKMSGTSMACPHVCGLICALLDKEVDSEKRLISEDNNGVSNDQQVRDFLKEKVYTIDVGDDGCDNSTGFGFLTYLTLEEFDAVWKTVEDYEYNEEDGGTYYGGYTLEPVPVPLSTRSPQENPPVEPASNSCCSIS